jgi:predicted RNA binding protein YcfA (HicA-like mRNA interferase family)
LARFGYTVVRQTGSHIRLKSVYTGTEHLVTIPNHDPMKLGTVNGILNDVSLYLGISKQELIQRLF